jgi:hypothetical protein
MYRGVATFTLDTGRCPRWLFERMVKLGREMTRVLVEEYGPEEFVRRIADPVWFQSLGTVLAFDWNASGLTTTLTAALKEAIRGQERDLGIFICGGKGATSRKTPSQIEAWGERLSLSTDQINNLVYNSRMSAKVDSALIQDGYQIYHHTFFFTYSGAWAVVQQGMNEVNGTARRYHWYSEDISELVNEPHTGIAAQQKAVYPLNLTAADSRSARDLSVEMIRSGYRSLIKDIEILRKHSSSLSQMAAARRGPDEFVWLRLANREFHTHPVVAEDFSRSRYLEKILFAVCERQPGSYEELLSLSGVGPKTIRALALVAEVIYGAALSRQDPARYSFAFGGKDATPYPVNRTRYDEVIGIISRAVGRARLDLNEKRKIYNRLTFKNINQKSSV